MPKKKTKKELIKRVEKAQKFLKHHKIKDAKSRFIDNYYGCMYFTESTRVNNLWSRKITDVEFTERLEKFCENPEQKFNGGATFDRFMKFVHWYTRLGGKELSREDIEKVYPKFS